MVVGYLDVIDGCTDGSVDKEDALKIELKDYGEIQGVPQDETRGDNAIPEKILDICRRTTADKDKVVETSVEVVSSSDESTAECYSSSDDDSNALDTVGKDNNNRQIRMTNEITECKDFWVAKTVNITNNYEYDKQLLDVQQLKSLTDGSPPKALWSEGLFPDESAERANAKVSHRLCKALAVVLSTVTLVLVVVIVVVEIWQLKKPEGITDNDNQYPQDVDIFGPTAPPNITLVTRQKCNLKDPASFNTGRFTMKPTPLVIISHTVTPQCFKKEDCCQQVRSIQDYHMAANFGDIGYHFLVGGDGRVYEGRKWEEWGAFLIGFNCMIGVTFIGDFTIEAPRHKQSLGAEKLLDELAKYGYLTRNYTVYGAKQVSNTVSPGPMVMNEIQKWPHWSSVTDHIDPPCKAKP